MIAKVYTELFGLQSYLINNVRSKKAKIKSNLLQPLALLEMGVYHKEKGGLQRVKFAAPVNPTSLIHNDFIKGSMSFFLAEVLYRSIQEEENNQKLFNFLLMIIEKLDNSEGNIANFHLVFMVQLSRYLGFLPAIQQSKNHCYFDKREGVFEIIKPIHADWMDTYCSKLLNDLTIKPYSEIMTVKIAPEQRHEMIDHLISYYKLHLDKMSDIKSYTVLKAVMN